MEHVLIVALLISLSVAKAEPTRVRKVEVKTDQIVSVRTAIGVATIIQVPDRPTSLVVGDSESFKIEYLDQAITIKPLRSNARSNLYIYTDWRRFNVQLVAGPEASADYVVYLTSPVKVPANNVIVWSDVSLSAKAEGLTLSLRRVGHLKGEYVFLDFQLSGRAVQIDPGWFWLTQSGKVRPVHKLALSKLSLDQDAPTEGLVQIRLKDISRIELNIEVRRKKNITLKIPREILWK